jgi:hypothetical protein
MRLQIHGDISNLNVSLTGLINQYREETFLIMGLPKLGTSFALGSKDLFANNFDKVSPLKDLPSL